jgi:glutamate carboxypeptidase
VWLAKRASLISGFESEETLDPRALRAYCQSNLKAMLECLRRAVEIESPTNSKAAVDRLAAYFAREFRRHGGKVRILGHRKAGSSVVAEFFSQRRKPGRRARPVLLLGHLDTVWDLGALERMPFRIRNGRAYGPGILDMKSGIVCGLWAIRALRALKVASVGPVRVFLNSDEEVSSLAFRKQITAEATRAKAVLVLEPAVPGGALKTARKGVGEFQLTAYGRSAHAGVDPGAGVNAIAELARQLLRIEKFARPHRGLTLNVGTVQGGTRTNVIPERASASVDVRIPRLKDRDWIERKVYSLRPIHPEARLEIRGGINRPPMERARTVALYRQARELGRQMGMDLEEASTGGGSDGNFTAALGIPTLDGLGGVGDGAHALDEHIIIRELPGRAALLAALLATL